MGQAATRVQIFLARLAVSLLFILALAGLFIHGMSFEVWERIFRSIAERPGGPMTLRFILQPVMASVVAAIDGVRDARSGASPYFWSLVTGSEPRGKRLKQGLIATSRIILLGIGMDVAYQVIEFKQFYPGEAAIVAILLAFVPYLLMRGPFARIARLCGMKPLRQAKGDN